MLTETNEPTVFRKTYSAPYVMDRGKLSRMISIIEQRLVETKSDLQLTYDVEFGNGKKLSLTSSQDLFALDNAVKNPIEALVVRAPKGAAEDYGRPTRVVLRFDSDRSSNIGLVVSSPNTKWAAELFSELEEQIDRTTSTEWIVRIFKSTASTFVLGTIGVLLFVAVLTWLSGTSSAPRFSKEEAAAFSKRLSAARTDSERIQALVKIKQREIELLTSTSLGDYNWPSLFSRRALFIALPVLLVIATLGYMIAACYPWSVFAWGDLEQHYVALVARRKTLWSVVIVSLILGIMSNLFVTSLANL